MEYGCGFTGEDEEMELPPGFRFHPTDEELITHYLSRKVLDSLFYAQAIGEVDFNKVEPWDLPGRAKMGEREWYFFCVRDRKYPTGMRTNRATQAGYWKATGKDKEIFRAKTLVGMKKTLVFYQGRAPKGSKSSWVMHEYRLEGKSSTYNLPKTAKNEWVICRIFQKSSDGKKIHISDISTTRGYGNESQNPNLPLLVEFSSHMEQKKSIDGDPSNMSCISAPLEDENIGKFSFPCSDNNNFLSKPLLPDMSSQFLLNNGNSQYFDSVLGQDQSILKFLLQNNELDTMRYPNTEFSPETTGLSAEPIVSGRDMCQKTRFADQEELDTGPLDLDCLWNY